MLNSTQFFSAFNNLHNISGYSLGMRGEWSLEQGFRNRGSQKLMLWSEWIGEV